MTDIRQAIIDAATAHDVPPAALLAIAQLESGDDPNAHNPSGASGLFQFMPATAQQYHLNDPYDPAASADAGARLYVTDAAALRQRLGREPTPGEVYLAHQQGAGGAGALLTNPKATAASVVGLQAVRQNLPKSMQSQAATITSADFAHFWTQRADTLAGPIPPLDIPSNADPISAGALQNPALLLPFDTPAPLTTANLAKAKAAQNTTFGGRLPATAANGDLMKLFAPEPAPAAPPALATRSVTTVPIDATTGQPIDRNAAPVPLPNPSFAAPIISAETSAPAQHLVNLNGKMVPVGSYPIASNPGSQSVITDDGKGNAVVKVVNLGFMNPAKAGAGTVANSVVGKAIETTYDGAKEQVGTALGNAASTVGKTASDIGSSALSGAQGLLAGLFSPQPKQPANNGYVPAAVPSSNTVSAKANDSDGFAPPIAPTTKTVQVINPDYVKWQAAQGGLATGTSQNTVSAKFNDTDGFAPAIKPIATPAPPQFITKTVTVAPKTIVKPIVPVAVKAAPAPQPAVGPINSGQLAGANQNFGGLNAQMPSSMNNSRWTTGY